MYLRLRLQHGISFIFVLFCVIIHRLEETINHLGRGKRMLQSRAFLDKSVWKLISAVILRFKVTLTER